MRHHRKRQQRNDNDNAIFHGDLHVFLGRAYASGRTLKVVLIFATLPADRGCSPLICCGIMHTSSDYFAMYAAIMSLGNNVPGSNIPALTLAR
jgi:hypothetical protein